MKNCISICLLLIGLCTCTQYPKLGEELLNLETVDFNKKIDDYYSKRHFLQKDTWELDYDSTNITTTYLTLGDSLSYFGEIYFNGIYMMKNKDEEFIALQTINISKDYNITYDFLDYLQEKYGTPIITERDWFGEYYNYRWTLNDRIIIVNSIYDEQKDVLSFEEKLEPVCKIELYIINRRHNEIIGKFHRGDWISLK